MAVVIGTMAERPTAERPTAERGTAKGAPIKGEVMGTGDIVTGVSMDLVEEKFLVIRQKVSEVALGNVEVLESVVAHGVTGAHPI
jgi:hypothetical protein